jgi:molybdopterin molybdotransferase
MTPSSLSAPLSVEQTQKEISLFVAELSKTLHGDKANSEQVSTENLLGKILSDDIVSPIDVPAHDNSAMDGYAVRFQELLPDQATTLPIVGTIFAGDSKQLALPSNSAYKIMTGAVMPIGADTVVPFENAQLDGETVTIPKLQALGQNRRFKGEDLTKNHIAIAKGKRCGPAEIGLIASLGISHCMVNARLKVAILSTGNELADFGSSLKVGQVFDSNRYTLRAMLTKLDVEVIDIGIVADDKTALEGALIRAAEVADVIISSGGVSVGEADFTREIMAKLGRIDFCTVAMRPGRPIAIGVIGNKKLYFGLPGNPVAVMMTFYFFVQTAIRQLAGELFKPRPMLQAKSLSTFRKKPGRTEYQRAYVYSDGSLGGPCVKSTGSQGSGVLRSMSEANCLVVLSHDQGSVAEGDFVDIVIFEGIL